MPGGVLEADGEDDGPLAIHLQEYKVSGKPEYSPKNYLASYPRICYNFRGDEKSGGIVRAATHYNDTPDTSAAGPARLAI